MDSKHYLLFNKNLFEVYTVQEQKKIGEFKVTDIKDNEEIGPIKISEYWGHLTYEINKFIHIVDIKDVSNPKFITKIYPCAAGL